jgi:hypothetical protein
MPTLYCCRVESMQEVGKITRLGQQRRGTFYTGDAEATLDADTF